MNTIVKKLAFLLSTSLALCCASASAGVIGFDDLSGDETVAIAPGYAGLNWDNVATVREDAYPGSGYAAGTVSHRNTAYNQGGATATVSKATGTFDFAGAWFTSAWMDQELSFEGSRGGTLLYSTPVSVVIGTAAPTWVGLGWAGIDTLVIYNSSGTPWAMDEFTVPEPGSLALFGAALVGLARARRRKPAR
jgi:hypothetical protein